MTTRTQPRSGYVSVNGVQMYHEVRGAGPSVVLVSGATGDAGHFTAVAELLADEFTVVTYDRRGNSRSAAPAGSTVTSTDQQGDDLARLIEGLGIAPAAVYGTSAGAIIALNAVLRHDRSLRSAILHEPPLMAVLERPEEAMAVVQPVVESGMAKAGPRGAVEAFLGFAAGDALHALDDATVERMLGNGEWLFGAEFGVFESWRPDETALARVEIPVQVLCGAESAPFFGEASAWIARRLGTGVVHAPGTHVPNFDRPGDLVDAIRPFLRGMT